MKKGRAGALQPRTDMAAQRRAGREKHWHPHTISPDLDTDAARWSKRTETEEGVAPLAWDAAPHRTHCADQRQPAQLRAPSGFGQDIVAGRALLQRVRSCCHRR